MPRSQAEPREASRGARSWKGSRLKSDLSSGRQLLRASAPRPAAASACVTKQGGQAFNSRSWLLNCRLQSTTECRVSTEMISTGSCEMVACRHAALSIALILFLVTACGRASAIGPGDAASAPRTASPSGPPGSPLPTPPNCAGGPPAAREAPSAALDTGRGLVFIFGGDVNGASMGDTWQYANGCWSQMSSVVNPPGRQSAALVYDPDVKRLLLLGGRKDDPNGPQTIPADAWTSDGQSWTLLSGAPHFSDVAAAYDETRHLVVALGNAREGVGTWTWDGTNWAHVSSTQPSVRLNPAMCFDTQTKSILLFGGAGSGTPVLADTWLWNGTTWTQQHPAHNPPARFEAALACGPQPVVFGGWADYQGRSLGDTWSWVGNDWRQLSPTHNPQAKPPMFGIFDGAHQLVFVGTNPGDIWAWSGSDWSTSF
jgi:hypothetical protein